MMFRKKKPEPKVEPVAPPTPKPLTEIELATKFARIRARTEEAQRLLGLLKQIKEQMEADGAAIEIVADHKVTIFSPYSTGSDREVPTFYAKSNYSAAL